MKRFPTSRIFTFLVLVLLAGGLTACDSTISGVEEPVEADLIVQASDPDFVTLTQAIEAAGLTATLRGEGPFTVFAPTNEAFAKLPEPALRALLEPENRRQLEEVLTAHVVPGRVFASDAFDLSSAKSIQGDDLNFREEGGSLYVNDARILATDIEASNGVIHAIDTVILPDWVASWLSQGGADDAEPWEFPLPY